MKTAAALTGAIRRDDDQVAGAGRLDPARHAGCSETARSGDAALDRLYLDGAHVEGAHASTASAGSVSRVRVLGSCRRSIFGRRGAMLRLP